MSTAVASATVAPLPALDRNPSPRSYPPLAPSTNVPSKERNSDSAASPDASAALNPNERTPSEGKRSPRSNRSTGNPKIVVKKEPPSSPSLQAASARHRPKKLDLNTNTNSISTAVNSRPSATPLTARDGLVMHDVGLACLSPGFQTQDPAMREQLERSISVRDQQRSIIQARLLKSARGDAPDSGKNSETTTTTKTPGGNSKKRPPPGLSIVPPPAERFANERVIQSAPLNQTFTGRHEAHPPSRQVNNQSSNLSQTSHIHHVPAIQTNNRLPPIADVFGANELNPGPARPPFLHTNSTSQNHGPPLPSPGFPPQTAHPMSHSGPPADRNREYRSAEEAVHEMVGGREDLLPKIVHYGGHQPPTPPSPHPGHKDRLTPHKYQPSTHSTSKRRSRNEYEEGSSPPLGSGRERIRYSGPFGEGRDSPATPRAKKEEFLSLCARAWDLFHS
ncbi:uncharacterized protein Z518_01690 [Rhinocladiella mackenziei CBS 650.93]|uniref:Uncharacterized protein n=1 Tax=Rhinocladiella mackenziei CBS 650.93 TaxID=1442369 RepID=A0A0D2J4I1_9EURO|nr:uncharacterized protein Z518_01690 [Rhinocladiella mackenziei CBS 650.93]KIX10606.1 hypothetical protein Z518_01690 [Rhinocladiella mackenziei CBS 650.93]